MFDVHVHRVGDTQVIAPAGELDLLSSRELGAALAAAAEYGATRVVLDLRRLTFVDSSGISLIIKFKRHYAAEGIRFGVVKGDEFVQRAFAVSHVEALLPWTGPPAATDDE